MDGNKGKPVKTPPTAPQPKKPVKVRGGKAQTKGKYARGPMA